MATQTVTSPTWNGKLRADPRMSVLSAQYAPSVFTFNANWTPAPLSAPAPLQFFDHSATASSSRASPSRWSTDESYLRAGPSSAPPETADEDGERVSHLSFDSDSEGDGDADAGEGNGEDRRFGHYDWQEVQLGRHGNDGEEDYSPDPTPTQEQPYFRAFAPDRRPIDPVTGPNADLRSYLESYGFPDGLGYERPPFNLSYRSPSPSSHYSSHNDDNSDGEFDKYTISKSDYDYPRSRTDDTSASYPNLRSELPALAPSAWPASLKASTALLTSLSLDSALLDDPQGAWETLCWDEAAPESDTDSEAGPEYERDGQAGQEQVSELRTGLGGPVESWLRSTRQNDVGLAYRVHEKVGEEAPWRESSPSPVFRRRDDITESDVDTETYRDGDNDDSEDEVRTVSNATWNDAAGASGASTNTSAGASTITTEDSEEWISLTGARAQAARARILPYRYLQAPFPTYPPTDADVAAIAASVGVGRTARTPVDPVLARTPPVAPVMEHHEAGDADAQTISAELGDVLVNTEGEGVADDETAPDYGECGRDRLVTLAERDPPPYDLEYESTYASRSQSRSQDRPGDSEGIQNRLEGASTSSQNHLQAQPKIFTHESATRTRSQLTFPTSPTECDTIQSTISPTSTYSSSATPLFSRSPTSPTTTETTALMTPAGPHLSTFSNAQSFRESSQDSHLALPSAKLGFNSGANAADSRSDSPPCHYHPNGNTFSPPMTATRVPRPLPPRPVGLGPLTMAEAWLSSSAAGPYASGSGTRAASTFTGPGPTWNALGNRSGLSDSFGIAPRRSLRESETGWKSPAPASDFDFAITTEERANASGEGAHRPESHENDCDTHALSVERPTSRYPIALMPSALPIPSERSRSTESLVGLNMIKDKEDDRERDSDESIGEFRSSSETAFQVIARKIRVETDGIGMQPAPSLQRGKRSRSGSGNSGAGKSLQRLATRCSTLTRRIGLVASGRER